MWKCICSMWDMYYIWFEICRIGKKIYTNVHCSTAVPLWFTIQNLPNNKVSANINLAKVQNLSSNIKSLTFGILGGLWWFLKWSVVGETVRSKVNQQIYNMWPAMNYGKRKNHANAEVFHLSSENWQTRDYFLMKRKALIKLRELLQNHSSTKSSFSQGVIRGLARTDRSVLSIKLQFHWVS